MALAVRGRASESMGELLQMEERASQRLRTTLKDMLLLWRLAAFPSGTPPGVWDEVQICVGLWLTTLVGVRDMVREASGHSEVESAVGLDSFDTDWYHVQPRPAIRALWDHVHNGVTTDYYWSTMHIWYGPADRPTAVCAHLEASTATRPVSQEPLAANGMHDHASPSGFDLLGASIGADSSCVGRPPVRRPE